MRPKSLNKKSSSQTAGGGQIRIPNRAATPLFQSKQGQQKTEIHFDPATRTVTLKLLVQDPNGYFIPNIRPENFVVYENGVRQPAGGLRKMLSTAHNDLERATEMARQMIMRYGMSQRLGSQVFGRPVTGAYLDSSLSFGENCNFSERTAERIDQEVTELIDRTYRRVKDILSRRRHALQLVTAELQKRETIGREELERIVAEAEAEPQPKPAAA